MPRLGASGRLLGVVRVGRSVEQLRRIRDLVDIPGWLFLCDPEGRLITKREAIERLPLVGVDPALADQVARRRAGERVVLSPHVRRLRARRVRSLVATAIGELLAGP